MGNVHGNAQPVAFNCAAPKRDKAADLRHGAAKAQKNIKRVEIQRTRPALFHAMLRHIFECAPDLSQIEMRWISKLDKRCLRSAALIETKCHSPGAFASIANACTVSASSALSRLLIVR
ncbi:hypothetical protein MHY1_02327 [Methylovirgula sp. HY1]|nr:hypothetical protein MHY1_02327 [Methylovirgula sp. HY1]